MVIFGKRINNGEKKYFTIPVGELAHKAVIEMPVIVVKGTKPGKTLWVNGMVHGDELNGSYAAWKLAGELNPEEMEGVLIVTPVANPAAFQSKNKISDLDYLDMDTTFPGDPEGMLAQRCAYILYQEIKKNADALISFHTMATPYKAVPYTVRKIVAGVPDEVNKIAGEMQKCFGVETNCLVDLTKKTNELPGVTHGALDITCLQDGIPAFMGEMGQGGRIEELYVNAAKNGIRNVMAYLGILHCTIQKAQNQVVITNRKFIRSDEGGFLQAIVKPGTKVKKDDSIATIHYFGDEVSDYCVKQDSYIIGIRDNPIVFTGERVAFIGTEWHEWKD